MLYIYIYIYMQFYNIVGKARATHSFLSEILLLPSANFVILSAFQLVRFPSPRNTLFNKVSNIYLKITALVIGDFIFSTLLLTKQSVLPFLKVGQEEFYVLNCHCFCTWCNSKCLHNFVVILQVWEAQNLRDHTKSGSSTRLLLICLAMLAWLPECHLRSLSKSVGNLPTWHEGSHAGPNVMIIDSTYM